MQKVLIFNLTPRGGMLHYSSQFANELAKTRSVTVAIADYHDSPLYDSEVSFFPIKSSPSVASFIFDSLAFWRHFSLLWKIFQFRPDIVHFIDNHPWYAIYAPLLKIFSFQVYVTQHDPILHSGESSTLLGKAAAIVNAVLRKVGDKVVVHGEKFRNVLIEEFGIPPNRAISVQHGAYDFFVRWKKGLPSRKDAFLFFGRIVDYKGLDLLLEAMPSVIEEYPLCKLVIAGAGDISPYADSIKRLSANVDVDNREIEAENVHAFFERSEFVVLPYRDATASGVIPVAYAFSKPVVVTNVGTLSEYLIDGRTGVMVPPNDPKSLANAIKSLLSDKDRAMKMGIEAAEFSKRELGWGPIVASIYDKP